MVRQHDSGAGRGYDLRCVSTGGSCKASCLPAEPQKRDVHHSLRKRKNWKYQEKQKGAKYADALLGGETPDPCQTEARHRLKTNSKKERRSGAEK